MAFFIVNLAHGQENCDNSYKSQISDLLKIQKFKATPKTEFELSPFEKELLNELNLARSNPQQYAELLKEHLLNFTTEKNFKANGKLYATHEGKKAVEEAITFLESQAPQGEMKLAKGMTLAARDHVKELGPLGKTGHYGSDGTDPLKRVKKYGVFSGEFSENISYSSQNARGHLIALIVDDGVASRGHRKNIFNPALKTVGVGCGDHVKFTTMCVMDYAGKYTDKKTGGAILLEEF